MSSPSNSQPEPEPKRLRVLVVAHNAVAGSNRARMDALAALPDLEVRLVTPPWWDEEGRRIRAGDEQSSSGSYQWDVGRAVGCGNGTRYWYRDTLARVVRTWQPDVLDVYEEPFSLAAFQCAVLRAALCRKAALVFYSAVNVPRRWRLPYRLTEKVVLGCADGCYAPSREVGPLLVQRGLRAPCWTIPLGVDAAQLARGAARPDGCAPARPPSGLPRSPTAAPAGSFGSRMGVWGSEAPPEGKSPSPAPAAQEEGTARQLTARHLAGGAFLCRRPWGGAGAGGGGGDFRQTLAAHLAGLPRPRVGFVGRIEPVKGLDVLLAAVERCALEGTFLLAGAGTEKARLLRSARDRGLGERVHFLPPVPYRDLPCFLQSLDALVLPSVTLLPLHREQFGRVLVEAMAAGTPVIGSDSGAIPEVIGDAGLVVREGDADALGQAIRRVTSDPALARTLSQRGAQRVAQYYAWPAVAQLTREMYRAALTRRLTRAGGS